MVLERLIARDGKLPENARKRVRELESAARDGIGRLSSRLADAPEVITSPRPVYESVPEVSKPAAVRKQAAMRQVSKRSHEYDDVDLDLDEASIKGGSLLDKSAVVPVVWERDSTKLWFHMEASDPRRGDFAEFAIPIKHESNQGQTLAVRLRQPYWRPKNQGRLVYQVLLDDRILLEEDAAFWSEINTIRVIWRSVGVESHLRIRAVAKKDCKPWNWGRAGRLLVLGISHRVCEHDGPLTILNTSPFSRTLTMQTPSEFAFGQPE